MVDGRRRHVFGRTRDEVARKLTCSIRQAIGGSSSRWEVRQNRRRHGDEPHHAGLRWSPVSRRKGIGFAIASRLLSERAAVVADARRSPTGWTGRARSPSPRRHGAAAATSGRRSHRRRHPAHGPRLRRCRPPCGGHRSVLRVRVDALSGRLISAPVPRSTDGRRCGDPVAIRATPRPRRRERGRERCGQSAIGKSPSSMTSTSKCSSTASTCCSRWLGQVLGRGDTMRTAAQ